jgi:hypothetical protein
MNIEKMKTRIQKIKSSLQDIGDMRSGSLNEQYSVCGVKDCACVDPEKPKKHGPYFQLSYVHQGKSSSQFIQKEFVVKTKKQLLEFKKFKLLKNEWIDLSLKVAKEELQQERDRLKNEKKLKKTGAKS